MEPQPIPTAPTSAPKPEPASLPAPVSRPVAPTVPSAPAEVPVPTPEPKRFIRTFASDMEALKSGKAADLAPLKSSPAAPPPAPEAKPAAAPEVSLPTAQVLPAMPAAPLSRGVGGDALPEVALLRRAPPPPPAAPLPPPPPPLPVVKKGGPSPVETYEGDFTKRMKDANASKATLIAAEQDAGKGSAPAEPVSRTNSLYVGAGALLLIAGVSGAYVAYTHYVMQNAPVMLAPAASAPIFYEDRQIVNGTGDTLMQAIEQSVARPLPANAVRLLSSEATTTDSIFTALELPAPGVLLRNTLADGSMAGIINTVTAQSPFFIVHTTSYGETFSGMLAWEVRMPSDLAPLFPKSAVAVLATSTAPTATSTPASVPSATGTFKDQVIANHDARVYRGADGQSIVYGYWDANTLVIARDAQAFTAILSRLATSRKAQ